MPPVRVRSTDRRLAEDLATLFSRTGRRLYIALSRALEKRGEPMLEWKLLRCLQDGHASTQRDIAELTALDPAAVSRVVEQLEEQGFVRRRRDARDRRKIRVEVTPRGKVRLAAAREVALEAIEEVLAALDRTDRTALKVLLEKLLVEEGARPMRVARGD
jgi:DNA-binding MarR family transcriptional regulator